MLAFHIICFILSGLCVVVGLANIIFGLFHVGVVLLFAVAIIIAILPFLWKGTKKRNILRRILITVYAIGFGTVALLSGYMAYHAWFTPPPSHTETHYIIVLGAGLRGDRPSLMLRRRLDAAKQYMDSNPKALCIVSGGQGDDEIIPEALAMKNYLVEKGLAADRIIMENKSTNTRENLRFSMAFLPPDYTGGISIASDGYHQARAYITAKDLGFDPIYAISASTNLDILPAYWLRDLAGIIPTWLETKGIKLPFLP